MECQPSGPGLQPAGRVDKKEMRPGSAPNYYYSYMKFANKLLLALSTVVIASVAALVPLTGTRTTKVFEGQLAARLEDNAHHMLDKLDWYLDERFLEVKKATSDPAFLSATTSSERTSQYLQEFLHWHREYLSAAFLTMERVVVADTAELGAGEREDQAACLADLGGGKDVAVCVQHSSPGGSPTIRLAAVVRDRGAALGVVVLRLPLQVFDDRLHEAPGFLGSDESLHIDLVDRNGIILYSNYERGGLLREASPHWDFIKGKIRAGQTSGSLRYANPAEKTGEAILVFVQERRYRNYPGNGWTLNLFVPTAAVSGQLRNLQLGNIAVILVTDALLLTILFLLVRSFTRPIEELGRAAREIGKGNLDVRVPGRRRDELGLFAETFNRMATDVQKAQLELTTFSSELEELVEERTAELLRTNELLHAELSERVKAQATLQERGRLLRMSADIAEAMNLALPLQAVLQLCAGHITRNLDIAFVRIWTSGAEAGVLELKASAGIYTRLDGQHSRKIVGELKIGIIAREQRPILTNAVIGDPAITDQEWARREGMVAFAGHPLVVDGKTVGVMALFSRRPLESFVLTALSTVSDRLAAFVGRKQAEEALLESEKRYRELFDSASDGIYRTDAQGVFTIMNRAGARIFGHENPEEIVGRPARDYWRDPEDRKRFLRELEREKSVRSFRIAARKKGGEFLELETSSRILEGDGGAFLGIEGMLRDVSERVISEAERDLLLAQLQEAANNIKTLSGLLPICAGCKKIRNDKGSWSQIETYISQHSEAEFSHGLCPECRKVYFPGVADKS